MNRHDAYAHGARLRQAGWGRRPPPLKPVVDQDQLDKEFAELMIATPSHYPAYRGIPLEKLVAIVKGHRLEAEAKTGK